MESPILQPLPPAHCGRLIETYAGLISDPAQKLRFLKRVLTKYGKTSRLFKCSQAFQETVLIQIATDELNALNPRIRRKAKLLIRNGQLPTLSGFRGYLYKFRNSALTLVAVALVLGLGSAVASLKKTVPDHPVAVENPQPGRVYLSEEVADGDAVNMEGGDLTPADKPQNKDITRKKAGSENPTQGPVEELQAAHSRAETAAKDEREGYSGQIVPLTGGGDMLAESRGVTNSEHEVEAYVEKAIWLVEKESDSELYSNGLRIITRYTVENEPRAYYRFQRAENRLPSSDDITDKIAGILYHAAESDMIDFKPEKNDSINRYSKALVRYVRKKKAYHYFIDRFGRVYRIVKDAHAAHHAGWSIWADKELVYLSLNHAFIGICFEGKDFESGGEDSGVSMGSVKNSVINEGQLTSGKKLTDWLRVKYRIPQHNCVAHGLASVNPHQMLIGYHLDLAKGFPYARFGLKDKTKIQLPAITDFGFRYDDHFVQVFNGDLWEGIAYSDEYIRHHAQIVDMTPKEYRDVLAERFTAWFELYQDFHG